MKSKLLITLLTIALAAIILSTTGCSSSGVALTGKDNGSAVTVNTGDTFTVQLAGNPSTGFTWEAKDLDTSILEQVGDPKFDSSNPALVGSGGSLTLTFKALKPGATTLTLIYHRPWETDVAPIDTFSVTVTVK
jgi:inhibitor of cysteine peptidase